MSHVVMLDLPDDLGQRARVIAAQTHRRVEDVLLEWLGRGAADIAMDQLPDDQVLTLCDLEMSEEQQHELNDLLARQREGLLESDERHSLNELMGIYRRGMIQKAQALKEAVDRGLRPPLN